MAFSYIYHMLNIDSSANNIYKTHYTQINQNAVISNTNTNSNNTNTNSNTNTNNTNNNNTNTNTHLNYYFHGAISGIVGIIISHPIDTIKTHIQTNNTFKTFNMSIPNLYKGLLAPLIGVGLEKAIVFGTYNFCINKFNTHNTYNTHNTNILTDIHNSPSYVIPISGAIAGLSASIIVSPYERLKILKQNSTIINIKNINTKFLYTGFSATITREVPGFAIYFSVYENLKYHTFTKYNKKINYINSFMFGGIAGVSAWVFIYPQDRIKTILQSHNIIQNNTTLNNTTLNNTTLNNTKLNNTKHNFITVMNDIYSKGGIKYFYKGFSYAVVRAMFLHSGTFCMMEFLQNIHS